jgi:hypothetical protein
LPSGKKLQRLIQKRSGMALQRTPRRARVTTRAVRSILARRNVPRARPARRESFPETMHSSEHVISIVYPQIPAWRRGRRLGALAALAGAARIALSEQARRSVYFWTVAVPVYVQYKALDVVWALGPVGRAPHWPDVCALRGSSLETVRGPQMSRDWDPDRRAAAFEKLHNRSRSFAPPTASLRTAHRAVLIERGAKAPCLCFLCKAATCTLLRPSVSFQRAPRALFSPPSRWHAPNGHGCRVRPLRHRKVRLRRPRGSCAGAPGRRAAARWRTATAAAEALGMFYLFAAAEALGMFYLFVQARADAPPRVPHAPRVLPQNRAGARSCPRAFDQWPLTSGAVKRIRLTAKFGNRVRVAVAEGCMRACQLQALERRVRSISRVPAPEGGACGSKPGDARAAVGAQIRQLTGPPAVPPRSCRAVPRARTLCPGSTRSASASWRMR